MANHQCPACGAYTRTRSDTRPAEAERVRGKRLVGHAKRANGRPCETRFASRVCPACGWESTPSATDLLPLRREAKAGRVTLLVEYAGDKT